ncbi:PREDICTED: spermatogenesis-associated protein 31E1-like, partial [Propithecus coquereli]|uniref:spermatogenesis-associated protein 31E1-like n=1 Tax=Propithecus coquereli TaxID=379532 RepID=UPI00063F98A5
METNLMPLKSISPPWMGTRCTNWVLNIFLVFICGMGLFFLFILFWQSDPSSPRPGQKRSIRKHPVGMMGRPKSKNNSSALKACRDCLRELEGARDLTLLLQSHLGKLSCPVPPGEECQPVPARAHQPRGERVEDASPATSSPLASPTPLTKHPPPVASTLSVQPQGDQSDLKRVPPGTIPESSPTGYSCYVPPVWAISGLECIILFLSRWWAVAKGLFSPTLPHCKSQQEPLLHHPPEAWFWGNPTYRQMEAGGPTFLNPDGWKLLEIFITKRAALKLGKEKEKEGSFLKQISPDYPWGSLGNMIKSLGEEQDTTTPRPFWNMQEKPEQLSGPQGEFPGSGPCGAEDKHGASLPSQPPESAGESSKDEQKMGSRHSGRFSWNGSLGVREDKNPSGHLGQDLERVPEDPCTGSSNTSVKLLEEKEEEDGDLTGPQGYKSGNYLPRGPEKQQLEKTLKSHLERKPGEIGEGMVPVRARQSWLTASRAVAESDTRTKPRNLAPQRGQKCYVGASRGLSFLHPCTQQMLEVHIIRFRVRHRWRSNLQSLEPINLKAQPPPLALSTLLSVDIREFEDNSIVKAANFLGETSLGRSKREGVNRKLLLSSLPVLCRQAVCPGTAEPGAKAGRRGEWMQTWCEVGSLKPPSPCAMDSSSCYLTLWQCLAGPDPNTTWANKECQAALEVLQESWLYGRHCRWGMKKELQCLQIYRSTNLGWTE